MSGARPSIATIVKHASAIAGFDVRQPTRAKSVSHARFAVFAAARSLGYSTSQIGRRFGMDHTTIIYGSRRADAAMTARILGSSGVEG